MKHGTATMLKIFNFNSLHVLLKTHINFHIFHSLIDDNVSGYSCVSDCRSRGREFDPGPVPYFRGD